MDLEGKVDRRMHSWLGPDWAIKKYVLSVSGGRDSMALLRVFLKLTPKDNLFVAHFNHMQRGLDSEKDARFVSSSAGQAKIGFQLGTGSKKPKSELVLRKERRKFLRRVKRDFDADWILTAHHSQDQLETLFMRLVRGTGLRGLCGIPFRCGPFAHPFLDISREQIDSYLKRHAIHFREDESNRSQRYFRNRVRQELIPPLMALASEFGGYSKFSLRFRALGRELSEVERFFRRRCLEHYNSYCHETSFWIRLNRVTFQSLPPIERSLLVRKIFRKLGTASPDRRKVGEILCRISKGTRRLSSSFGVELEQSCGEIYFSTLAQRDRLNRLVPPRKLHRGKIQYPSTGTVVLGLKSANVDWRYFRAGDVFMSRKLKHLFLKARIPRPERALLPVVAEKDSKRVIWFYPHASTHFLARTDFPFSIKQME